MLAETDSFRQGFEIATQHLEALRQQLALLPDRQAAPHPALEALAEALVALNQAHGDLSRQNEACVARCRGLEAECAYYRDLFEYAPHARLLTDLSAAIQAANAPAATLLRASRDSLVGQQLVALLPEHERQSFCRHLARLQAGGVLRDWEVHLHPACGDPVPASLDAAPVHDQEHRLVGLQWLLCDVSASKRASEREELLVQVEQDRQSIAEMAADLEQERDILRTIMENTGAQLAYLDPEFNFVQVNSAYIQGCGHRREELIGRYHFELFPNPENQAIFERVRDTAQPVYFQAKPFEYSDQLQRGTTYWDWSLVPVLGAAGNVQGLVLSLVDVTDQAYTAQERERLLAENRAQREFLERLVETAPVGIAVLRGPEHRYELANPYYRAMTGAPDRPIIGRTIVEAIPDLPARGMPPLMDQVYSTGQTVSTREVQLSIGPGREETYWNTDRVPLRGPDGTVEGILVLAQEVTSQVVDRRRIEALSRHAQRQAEEVTAVLNAIPEAVAVWDASGSLLRANPAAVALGIGPGASEATAVAQRLRMRKSDGGLMPPQEMAFARALRGETVLGQPEVVEDASGERRELLVAAAPIFSGGEAVASVVVLHDITEQRKAEAEREQLLAENRAQREFLESLLETAPVGIAVLRGPEHRYELANPYYRAMTGAPDRPIIGRTIIEAIPDLPARGMPPLMDQVYSTGRTVSTREVQLSIGPRREETYWNTDRVPLRGPDGRVEGILVLAQEVTSQVLDRRRIEALSAQAQRQAAELEAIFLSLVEPVTVFDAAGVIQRANPAAVESLGLDPVGLPEAVLSQNVSVRYPDGRPIPADDLVVIRALQGERVKDEPQLILRARGDERAIVASAAPIVSAGQISGAVAVWHDITELKRAEAALRESEEKLSALFDLLPIGLSVLDGERNLRKQNPALARILDLPEDELLRGAYQGRRYLRPDGTEMSPEEFPSMRAFHEQREVRDVEIGIVKENGESIWTSVSAAPLPFADWRAAVITTDITGRKLAEEALQRERDFSSAVLDTSGGLVVVLDREGRIVRFNRACEQITGYTFDEVKGQEVWDLLLIREEVESVRAAFHELQTGLFRGEHENHWRTRDGGRRWIRWSNTRLLGDDGAVEYFISTGIDITEHREAEEQLQAALQQSRQRQKEISALLAGARQILEQRTFVESARSILETCKGLIGAQAGYVALSSRDGSENELVYLDSGGLPCAVDPALPMPIRGLRGQVYRTGRSLYENAFPASHWVELLPEGHAHVENLLFAPLLMGDQVLGLLGLANKPGGFDDNDMRVAEAFGELAVIALHNSRLLQSLEASERRFRAVVETASAAIITADSRGQIASWNRTAEMMFGYTADEMVGTPMIRIIPERFRTAHYQGMGRALSTGTTRLAGETVGSVGARKDGSEFPLEMSLATWQTAEGSFFTAIMHDITERRRVEEALRQATQSIEALIHASPLAIITLDPDLNVRLWNPAAERIFGWSEQEVLGQPYPLVPDARQEEYRALLDRIWQGQALSGFETQRQRKGGALIDVALWTSPLYNTEGQVAGLMAIVDDITERKQAEEALRSYADEQTALYAVTSAVTATLDLDKLLATVLDAVLPFLEADAGWILLPDPTTDDLPRTVAWRGTPEALLNAEALAPLRDCPVYEELLGRNEGPVEPRLVVACPRLSHEILTDSGLYHYVCVPLSVGSGMLGVLKIGWRLERPRSDREHRLLMSIGRQVGMALHNAQLYQAARQVDRLQVLSALDRALAATLDPRRVAEETLRHVAASLDAPAAVVLLLPRPGDTSAENQVFTPEIGWRIVEVPAENSTRWQAFLARLADGPDPLPFPADELAATGLHTGLSCQWGDHGLAIAISGEKNLTAVLALGGRPADRPFTGEDRALAQVAARHAGQAIQNAQLYVELKGLLYERDQARAQLIQSDKMAALGRLVASLAHEINNPLQSVLGCLTLLEEELDGSRRHDKLDRYLSVVQEEIERITTVVRRMREFYRPAREGVERIDLHGILDSVLDLSGKQLQHSHLTVEREWAVDLPFIEANPDHLKQVFLNLVLNAIDATPGGGTLRIATAVDRMPGSSERQQRPAVRIEFSDTGQGMPPEVLMRLFEPFFTTKEHGAGLGLSISYNIIQAHHGDIAVTSQEGVGTTFIILLPVVQP